MHWFGKQQFRHEISWIPLRRWHPAFRRAWWIGGQIGKYANDAYTVGIRICGLFVAVWLFRPNIPPCVTGAASDMPCQEGRP